MGSVAISVAPSNRIRVDSPSSKLGRESSTSTMQAAARQTSQAPALETGSSRSTPTTTTPTSSTSTAAPSTSALPRPRNDLPAYIRRQPSQTSAPPFMQHTPSSTSTAVQSHPTAPTAASHAPPSQPPNPSTLPSHAGGTQENAPPATESMTAASRDTSRSSPASPCLHPTSQSLRSLGGSAASSPSRIKVHSLSHIQSFASEEFLAQPRAQPARQWPQDRQYEISSMPVTDIIEMVAGLLTKITTTNDMHHEQAHRQMPADDTSNLTPQATSVLAFHGKNVPSISILSYLSRIHKYCPTTYEVFLSLLVYFDRMTELVNKGQLERLQRACGHTATRPTSAAQASPMSPPSATGRGVQESTFSTSSSGSEGEDQSQFFVVDSFNIHRLVIAGVTCASKFFSDVFYTNSRYAKVGGLPLVELNHLELQFLVLNDFRLSIPVEELEAYGTMLVDFYAREIVAQQQQQEAPTIASRSINPYSTSDSEGVYMQYRDKRLPIQPEVSQTQTPTPP